MRNPTRASQSDQPPKLVGYVDSSTNQNDWLRITGWVASMEAGADPLEVLFRAQDGAEVTGRADLPRPDLFDHGVSNIMAGFDVSLATSRAARHIDCFARSASGWVQFAQVPLDSLKTAQAPTARDVALLCRVLYCREAAQEEVEQHLERFESFSALVEDLLQSNEVLRAHGAWIRVLAAQDPRGMS